MLAADVDVAREAAHGALLVGRQRPIDCLPFVILEFTHELLLARAPNVCIAHLIGIEMVKKAFMIAVKNGKLNVNEEAQFHRKRRKTPIVVGRRFEQVIENTLLPPPGPAHFAARRALWRRPISFPPPRTEQSAKLRELLDQEGAVDSDEVWNNGLDKIWKGVTGGGRLKRRLPMRYLVRQPSLTQPPHS